MSNDISIQELAAQVREVRDKQQIKDVCHTYCRALDRVDEKLLRSVFHPDSTHQHGPYKGPSSEFCGYAMDVLNLLERTTHQLGNTLIDLQGDVAFVESYFLAYHRIAKGKAGNGVFETHDVNKDEDIWIAGRYIDRFERRDGVWKIAHRTGVHDWEAWSDASDRHIMTMGPEGRGQRNHSDPAFSLKATYRKS